jgi:crotonobetainyl-CoA:carnitine CoA-transferase CaiB-like acyl-CoA transferase
MMSTELADRPLDGLRVVEISQLIAAPLCGLALGDLGADVVKVEGPHGDYTRTWALDGSESAIFRMLNRGKRAVLADHRTPEGALLVRQLIERADIVVENLGDSMVSMFGIDYHDAASANPGLIWCSITGMGRGAHVRAVDMTLQASMGMTALTGEADGPPLRGAMPFVDLMTGMYAAQAVLVACMAEAGRFIDCAMVDAAAMLTAAPAALSMSGYSRPRRMGSENDLFVPSRVFETSDGQYVHVVAISELHWRSICQAVGRDGWIDDERFASNAARLLHRSAIHDELARHLRTRPAAYWTTAITAGGGFCERVREIEEAWSDPIVSARGLLLRPDGGPATPRVTLVGRAQAVTAAPLLGEHTAEVKRELE